MPVACQMIYLYVHTTFIYLCVQVPLVGWQMSVAAYFEVHHIELLLDAPINFSNHNFHTCSTSGGGGTTGGCLCLDAVVNCLNNWARQQHGDLLEIAPRFVCVCVCVCVLLSRATTHFLEIAPWCVCLSLFTCVYVCVCVIVCSCV